MVCAPTEPVWADHMMLIMPDCHDDYIESYRSCSVHLERNNKRIWLKIVQRDVLVIRLTFITRFGRKVLLANNDVNNLLVTQTKLWSTYITEQKGDNII